MSETKKKAGKKKAKKSAKKTAKKSVKKTKKQDKIISSTRQGGVVMENANGGDANV